MNIRTPFHRIYRPQIDWPNSWYNDWIYIIDQNYAKHPEHYTRAYKIIQDDLLKLFEYIEPSDINLETYSYRIHELFMRTCIEIEANFKAILKENWYEPKDKNNKIRDEKYWNINDYMKINESHLLEKFTIDFPIWEWEKKNIIPFQNWGYNSPLNWYQDYNNSKHDRHLNFKKANFENLINAVSWLLIILSSQFRTEDFFPGTQWISWAGDSYYWWNFWIWDYFIINFPKYEEKDKYNFIRNDIKNNDTIFQKYNYLKKN